MTRPALSELHSIRRSMQKRLAFYMITLAILLAATLVAGLFFFDQLKSPREGMVTSLNFRMEAFASDMESLWRNVSVMGVHLSEDMTAIIEAQAIPLSSLNGNAETMEELRAVFADRFVLSCINQKVLNAKHFEKQENGAVLLTDEGRRAFLNAWQQKKREVITHPFLKEKLCWGLVPYVQALLLARTLRGDLEVYPPFFWK